MKKNMVIILLFSVAMMFMCGCSETAEDGGSETASEVIVQENSTEETESETVEESEPISEWVGTYAGVFGSVLSLSTDGSVSLFHNPHEEKNITDGSWEEDHGRNSVKVSINGDDFYLEKNPAVGKEYYVFRCEDESVLKEDLKIVDRYLMCNSEDDYFTAMGAAVFHLEDLPDKPKKNGYAHETNRSVVLGGIEFEIPEYFIDTGALNGLGFGCKDEGQSNMSYYMNLGSFDASAEDMSFSELKYTAPYLNLKDAPKGSNRICDAMDCTIAGNEGRIFTVYSKEMGHYVRYASMYYKERNQIFVMFLMEDENSTYDCFDDFDRMLQEAHPYGDSSSDTDKVIDESYEMIYEEYSALIRNSAPRIAASYAEEVQGKSYDIDTLARICNDKVSELAQITNEGTGKMASYMWQEGGDYQVYNEWANKLNSVYIEEARQISDVYMDAARQSR